MTEISTVRVGPSIHGSAGHVREEVARRAYDVYGSVHHQSFETLHERGGFSAGELIAYLYAHSFPRNEWGKRVREAFHGMSL